MEWHELQKTRVTLQKEEVEPVEPVLKNIY